MEGQDGKSPRAHHEPALALARASSARERDMRKELEQWRQRGKRGKENVSSNSLDETKHRLSWESELRPLSPRPELRVSATRAAAAVGLLQKPTLCAPPSSPVSSGAVLGPRNGLLGETLPPRALVAAVNAAFAEAIEHAAAEQAAAALEQEEKQIRNEEEELHQQHLELLERLGALQAEAMRSGDNAGEQALGERFGQVMMELQELAKRQRCQELRAWRHRVRRHSPSWSRPTSLDMEDHLSRAHDIFTFWFFEMRDRLRVSFKPLEAKLAPVPEDHAQQLLCGSLRHSPSARTLRNSGRRSAQDKFLK
ncbi:unnamed protein product [Effrenium voratum]|nr:unnamed protein product [Effrenium voratum]